MQETLKLARLASLNEKRRADRARHWCIITAYYLLSVNMPTRMGLANLASSSVSVHLPYPGIVARMNTPQQLSREAIDEFKAIYKDEFGEELSDDEVREIATRLLRFFGIINKNNDGSVDASATAR